ncbi:carotenoid biosynthesis protein [bacterium]|nr:MAG: carotenoid biosynthesis protein [bacterium]
MGSGVSPAVRLYLGLVAFSLAGTAFSRFSGLDPGPIAPVTAAVTLGTGLWAALGAWVSRSSSRIGWLIGAAIFGAASEIVGVVTGWPFGRYVYTDRWWPTIPLTPESRFPLLVPFAWLLVVGAAWACTPGRGWRRVLLAALIATLVDGIMEPVMAGPLGYWRWLDGGPLPGDAPVLNALGWFGVAAIAGGMLEIATGKGHELTEPERKAGRMVLGGQVVLTCGLGILLGG